MLSAVQMFPLARTLLCLMTVATTVKYRLSHISALLFLLEGGFPLQ